MMTMETQVQNKIQNTTLRLSNTSNDLLGKHSRWADRTANPPWGRN